MKPVEIVSSEERQVWRERRRQLELHKINKKKYYPNELDNWDALGKEIIYKYNFRLQELNKKRKQVEEDNIELKKQQLNRGQEQKVTLTQKQNETKRWNKLEKEKIPVIIRRSRRVEMVAAQALLELKTLRL